MTELKPCPFCGDKDISLTAHSGENSPTFYWNLCVGCSAQSRSCDTEAEADEAWNTRAQQQPTDTQMLDFIEANDGEACAPQMDGVEYMFTVDTKRQGPEHYKNYYGATLREAIATAMEQSDE